jgi:hypothetical protein
VGIPFEQANDDAFMTPDNVVVVVVVPRPPKNDGGAGVFGRAARVSSAGFVKPAKETWANAFFAGVKDPP